MRSERYHYDRDKIIITIFLILNCVFGAFTAERIYSKIFLLNGKTTSIYPQSVVQLKDIIADQSMHVTTSNDPWIYCEIEEKEISQIEIQFSQKIKSDIQISIYYACNEGFSQERCVGHVARAGDVYTQIKLPKGRYNRLRVDIGNAENISYMLGDIKIGNSMTPVKNWSIFLMLFAGFLVLAERYTLTIADFLKRRPELKNLFLGVDAVLFIFMLRYLLLGEKFSHSITTLSLLLLFIALIRFEFSFLFSRNTVKETVR